MSTGQEFYFNFVFQEIKKKKMKFNSPLFSLTLYLFKDFIPLELKHTVCVYLAVLGDD